MLQEPIYRPTRCEDCGRRCYGVYTDWDGNYVCAECADKHKARHRKIMEHLEQHLQDYLDE